VFEASLNGGLFREYMSQFPVPTLQERDVAIMDNLTAHKVDGVADLIFIGWR
jgi:hypothetical protein